MIALYVVGLLLGIMARTVIPYARMASQPVFHWKYVATAVASALFSSLPLISTEYSGLIDSIPVGADLLSSFVFGVMANDGLNKLVSTVPSKASLDQAMS